MLHFIIFHRLLINKTDCTLCGYHTPKSNSPRWGCTSCGCIVKVATSGDSVGAADSLVLPMLVETPASVPPGAGVVEFMASTFAGVSVVVDDIPNSVAALIKSAHRAMVIKTSKRNRRREFISLH